MASVTSFQQAFPQQCRKLENEQLDMLLKYKLPLLEGKSPALFIGVAFELFICLLVKNFSKLS